MLRPIGLQGSLLAAAAVLAVALQGCDRPATYNGTDKIDFALPQTVGSNSAGSTPTPGATGQPATTLEANPPSGEFGVLVDGNVAPNALHVNDAGFTSSAVRVQLPNRVARSFWDIFYPDRRQEIIAFTNDRRPEFLNTPWRNGEDIVKVDFKPRVDIAVTVWIVTGAAPPSANPFADQRLHAQEALLRTASIWSKERVGFGFRNVRFVDATSDPQAGDRDQVPAGPSEDDTWRPLRDQIGFDRGSLNVYWVDTVNGSPNWGWSNFGAQIVMGRNTGDELLAHEIGHALSLRHVNEPVALPNFDQTNIMHNDSAIRSFITEGQTVRMQMNPGSFVWTQLIDGRPSRPACGLNDRSGICPAIDRRLWADGVFPANN